MVFPFLMIVLLVSDNYLITSIKLVQANVYFFNKFPIHVGTPSTVFEIGFDITSEKNWLFNKESIYNSSTIKILNENIQMDIDNKTYQGNEIEDIFFLDDDRDKPITVSFYLLKYDNAKIFRAIKGVLAFPFKYKDKKQSIIHQLKHKGFIDHLAFSYIKQEYKAQLFLGGIKEVFTQRRHYSYCDVLGLNSKWSCTISGIILRNKTKKIDYKNYITNGIAYFDTMSHLVYIPSNCFNALIEKYYNEHIDSGVCNVRNSAQGRYLSCRDEYLFKMGNITFIIGNFAFEMELEKFFVCTEEFCHYLIHDNPHSNDWILGSTFFDIYNTVFDYEAKRIHFYSISKVPDGPYTIDINIPYHQFALIKVVFGLAISMNIIGVNIMLYMKTRIKLIESSQ